MTSEEYAEWRAEYQAAPWGELRADLAAGTIAATFANAHRAKDAAPYSPLDFAPYIQPEQAPEQAERDSIAQFFGG